MTSTEILIVLTAWYNNNPVQYTVKRTNNWQDLPSKEDFPDYLWDCQKYDYRVKPI